MLVCCRVGDSRNGSRTAVPFSGTFQKAFSGIGGGRGGGRARGGRGRGRDRGSRNVTAADLDNDLASYRADAMED